MARKADRPPDCRRQHGVALSANAQADSREDDHAEQIAGQMDEEAEPHRGGRLGVLFADHGLCFGLRIHRQRHDIDVERRRQRLQGVARGLFARLDPLHRAHANPRELGQMFL